ncbi:MAG: hypothetical protein ACKOXB_05510 [Flavobacteriales bacterium]
MKQRVKQIFIMSVFFLGMKTSAMATSVALDGLWLDEDNIKTAIVQNDNKVILNNKSGSTVVKMNGTVSGKTITVSVDQTKLTGEISDDNLVITWKNGSKWFRDISGTWANEKGNNLLIEQIGSFVRVKNEKGDVQSVGFLKDEGIVLIAKTTNETTAGSLQEENGIVWKNGTAWRKKM